MEEDETLRAALALLEQRKQEMKEAKKVRDERRAQGVVDAQETARMIGESQFLKAEVRRAKKHAEALQQPFQETINSLRSEEENLRKDRRNKSDALQQWLFSRFIVRNGRGEERNLMDIFRQTAMKVPPSGAGECCEPKLLQYAFLHGQRPLSMAMFWWGPSPAGEVRHHGQFYPACNGKCKPILSFMLQGIDVEPNALDKSTHQILEMVYEDRWLAVVNKPAGMLSVPGKSSRESVASLLQERWQGTGEPMMVHRLDMATSGLLVVARTKEVHAHLQRQFAERTIVKHYMALVEGVPKEQEGTVSLPLAADVLDRPRQKVDFLHGKEALTDYRVERVEDGRSLLLLTPHTGRTHQLRVHCAHSKGLGCPIVGDALYGKPASRLYLHAAYLEFTHPVTGKRMTFEAPQSW